jgi:site-specific DNA-methyltransferase (adenine-specific)
MKKMKLKKKIGSTSVKRKKPKEVVLYNDDCIKALRALPSNSIESCVTDPPYHLTSAKKHGKKGFMGKEWDGGDIAFRVELWKEVFRVLKPGGHLLAFGHPRTYHRIACAVEEAGFEIRDSIIWLYGQGIPFGGNLKCLHQPIVLARKPFRGTKKANVAAYGTGKLQIDACRIENGTSRYPSNVIISEEISNFLGEKALFYYCPKISIKERNLGCEHLEAKPQNSSGKGRTYNDRCRACRKKFIGSEKTRCQCPPGAKKTDKKVYKNKNNHPTVKPIALMEYLCKLVTPKNGVCMDIFAGSGSTGIACVNSGFRFIGIEKEKDYFEIGEARIKHAQRSKSYLLTAA